MSERDALPLDLDALLANLEAQVGGYTRLATLAQRELDGLAGDASEDLGLLIVDQEEEALRLQALEQQRLALLGRLAAAWGVEAEALTISDLEEALPEEAAGRLRELRGRLAAVVEQLSGLNERNGRLLASAVRILARWRTFMVRSFQPAPIYSALGGVAPPDMPWALDEAA